MRRSFSDYFFCAKDNLTHGPQFALAAMVLAGRKEGILQQRKEKERLTWNVGSNIFLTLTTKPRTSVRLQTELRKICPFCPDDNKEGMNSIRCQQGGG
jgi:hypothetical protein